MERKKYRLIILWLLFFSINTNASYRTEIYSAYISNRMDLWKNVLDKMDAIPSKSNELLLELVNYQYGYIGYCIGFDKKDEARKILVAAQKNIELLEKADYKPSVVKSYKSAFYGYRIGLNPITAPVNGKKSLDYARSAIEIDPANYLGYVQMGNSEFYMPAAFGGSKKEALDYFMKAKELLEKNSGSLSEDWNYMSLLILIGQTHTYLKDYDSARKVYLDILKKEPGFLYVRDDLYPKLLKKMEN